MLSPCVSSVLVLLALCPGLALQPCLGTRTSSDAIIVLVHKSQTSPSAILSNLATYYPATKEADVLLWHDGTLTEADIPKGLGFKVRLCELWLSHGAWGPPQTLISSQKTGRWTYQYKFAIRFFAISAWRLLSELGYSWVMRLDEAAEIHSPIEYNLFAFMREQQKLFGFRQYSEECGWDDGEFSSFVEEYFNRQHSFGYSFGEYCNELGRVSFYNNFFITDLAWWLSEDVQRFLTTVDDTGIIFSYRHNDLVLQTAAIRNLMPARQRYLFLDWSFHHHVDRDGKVFFGGISIGTQDTHGQETLKKYISAHSVPQNSVQQCEIEHESCRKQEDGAVGLCTVSQTKVFGAAACLRAEPLARVETHLPPRVADSPPQVADSNPILNQSVLNQSLTLKETSNFDSQSNFHLLIFPMALISVLIVIALFLKFFRRFRSRGSD